MYASDLILELQEKIEKYGNQKVLIGGFIHESRSPEMVVPINDEGIATFNKKEVTGFYLS